LWINHDLTIIYLRLNLLMFYNQGFYDCLYASNDTHLDCFNVKIECQDSKHHSLYTRSLGIFHFVTYFISILKYLVSSGLHDIHLSSSSLVLTHFCINVVIKNSNLCIQPALVLWALPRFPLFCNIHLLKTLYWLDKKQHKLRICCIHAL
jgi:hypothetical protein